MASLLKRMQTSAASFPEDDSDTPTDDWSFALEYNGPPPTHSIPQALPFRFDQIPIAIFAPSSASDQLSLPVVIPIKKTSHVNHSISSCADECGGHEPFPTGSSGFPRSGQSSPALPSEDSKSDSENPEHVMKRPSALTFKDPESNKVVIIDQGYEHEAEISTPAPPNFESERNVNQRSCYRCNKGINVLMEKECCIVCGAMYGSCCLLKAMGCMPEGRKCIGCIRCRIDESKRARLGKCSRLLKRLFTESEINRIMDAEKYCEANQVAGELVVVNGEPLSQEKIVTLQSCVKPPRNLKPGCYWYDKASGYWGKEGQKPSQIISPRLDVGGNLRRDASNGNTKVLINNREITKAELRMLKIAGVPCEGNPNFWLSPDGSYLEEGQKDAKGRLWDKTKTKVVCAILSLPVPSATADSNGEEAQNLVPKSLEPKMNCKILLIGCESSGTSTLFKQAKLVYNVPFSEDELRSIKLVIQSNLYSYLGILLEGRERFEEEGLAEKKKIEEFEGSTSSGGITDETMYSISPRLKAFSDFLLQVMVSGKLDAIFPAASREYGPLVEELWKDAALQATYSRRNELETPLPRAASYFLNRAIEISRSDYEPSETDILYAEGITSSNSIISMEFSFPKSSRDDSLDNTFYENDPSLRYQLVRVHPRSLGENCKWIEMFEDTDIVLFCASLSDYDEDTIDSNGVRTNKMLASKQLFEKIITHPSFKSKRFLLILNKLDLLEEKIELVPLTRCSWFNDFNPVISHNHYRGNKHPFPLAQRASFYIAVKFKRLFYSITGQKLFVSIVTGLEPDTVDEALRYARVIMRWESEKEDPCSINELSSSSHELSSY